MAEQLEQRLEPVADAPEDRVHHPVDQLAVAELVAPPQDREAVQEPPPGTAVERVGGVLRQPLELERAHPAVGADADAEAKLRQVVVVVEQRHQLGVLGTALDLDRRLVQPAERRPAGGELARHEVDRAPGGLQNLEPEQRDVQPGPPVRRLEQRQQREQLAVELQRLAAQRLVGLELAHHLLAEADGGQVARRLRQHPGEKRPVDRQVPALHRDGKAVGDQLVQEQLVAEEAGPPGGAVTGDQRLLETGAAVAPAEKGRFQDRRQRLAVERQTGTGVEQVGHRDHLSPG